MHSCCLADFLISVMKLLLLSLILTSYVYDAEYRILESRNFSLNSNDSAITATIYQHTLVNDKPRVNAHTQCDCFNRPKMRFRSQLCEESTIRYTEQVIVRLNWPSWAHFRHSITLEAFSDALESCVSWSGTWNVHGCLVRTEFSAGCTLVAEHCVLVSLAADFAPMMSCFLGDRFFYGKWIICALFVFGNFPLLIAHFCESSESHQIVRGNGKTKMIQFYIRISLKCFRADFFSSFNLTLKKLEIFFILVVFTAEWCAGSFISLY